MTDIAKLTVECSSKTIFHFTIIKVMAHIHILKINFEYYAILFAIRLVNMRSHRVLAAGSFAASTCTYALQAVPPAGTAAVIAIGQTIAVS